MSWRAEEAGKSEGRSVIGRIETATLSRRASGLTSSRSFVTRQLAEPSQEEIANERGLIHVCILRQRHALGTVGLAQVSATRQEAASTHRQGNTGRPLGQGESLAMAADPFVFRQSLGR